MLRFPHGLTLAALLAGLLQPASPVLASSVPPPDSPLLLPEALPGALNHPLELLATTAGSGPGQDYFTLKPGRKAVIGTISGPAVIFRIWSTSSNGSLVSLDMTVDGKKQTLYEKGRGVNLAPDDPLRAMDKQAYWSYVPVPVRGKAVFTARSADPGQDLKFYLQVGYRAVSQAEVAQVSSLARGGWGAARQTVRKLLADPLYRLAPTPPAQQVSGPATPDKPWQYSAAAPSQVAALAINVGDAATIEQIQQTRFTFTCDGVRTIDTPLGALFGEYWQLADYTAAATAVRGKDLILRLPMPFAGQVSAAISGFGGKPLPQVTVTAYLAAGQPATAYRLCAQYFSQVSVKDQPLRLLQVSGTGLFVGSNLAADGLERKTFAFLEGNEQLYVDGAAAPTIEGTGTEDYFNNSWYFETGVLARPFHGVIFKQDREPPRVVAYRYMLPDCVPFKTGFTYDLQHGSRNGAPNVSYRGVLLWYQAQPTDVAEPVEAKLPVEPNPAATTRSGGASPLIAAAVVLAVLVAAGAFAVRRRRKVT